MKRRKSTWKLIWLLCLLFNISLYGEALAQNKNTHIEKQEVKYLRVGDKLPPEFWDIEHVVVQDNKVVTKNLSEYKGKPFLLDFWASWCGACMNNFPKLDEFKEVFGDDINFILVNSDSRDTDTIKIKDILYDKENGQYKTRTPSIIFDEYIKSLFPHQAIPHYIWIDNRFRVRAISTADFVTEDQLELLVNRYRGVR